MNKKSIFAPAMALCLVLVGSVTFAESANAAPSEVRFGKIPGGSTGPISRIYGNGSDGRFVARSNDSYTYFQSDGNFVAHDANRSPYWASGTRSSGKKLALQSDGNIVVYSRSDRPLWSSGTAGHSGEEFKVVMQDDTNFVLYSMTGGQHPLWSTRGGRVG
ncbi:hypothetical protein C5D50_10670 [Rathayibacter sp. RFBD1]|nr:hypothetical protein C5D50_10670 [Rathayibacter sp. RFBD1]PPI56912.1 hypothetical protein C5D38_10220 [Rathayibacter sp. TRS19]